MTYEYAERKLDELFNKALEHIDRINQMIEPDADWLDMSLWSSRKYDAVSNYSAAAHTVIEIYIELNAGAEDWRKLHEISWRNREKLDIEAKSN